MHHFSCKLYISLSIPPKSLLFFSTKAYSQFSTLQPVADLGLLQHLKWSFFLTAVTTRNHWLLSQIVPPYMLQVTGGGDSVLCLWSVANVTQNFSNKLVPLHFIRILDSQSNFSGRETNKNLWIFQKPLKNMIPKYYALIFSWCDSSGNYM